MPVLHGIRVLAIYAHPDDELRIAGTLAAFVAAGASVGLLCATRGELGKLPAGANGPEELAFVREAELRTAMAHLGVTDVRFLSHRDSGMAGQPSNRDPRALAAQSAPEVIAELVRAIREVRPHVVFTWDPLGGYGHPDHIAIHRHAMAAVREASDPEAHPGGGLPWRTPRLYWAPPMVRSLRVRVLERLVSALPGRVRPVLRRIRPSMHRALPGFGRAVTHIVEVSAFLDQKLAARTEHASQLRPDRHPANRSREELLRAYGTESFIQGWPSPARRNVDARGLHALLPPEVDRQS